jgi:hypothetical protein
MFKWFKLFKRNRIKQINSNIKYEECTFAITGAPAQINELIIDDELSKSKLSKVNKRSSTCKICGASVLNENETVCDTCNNIL